MQNVAVFEMGLWSVQPAAPKRSWSIARKRLLAIALIEGFVVFAGLLAGRNNARADRALDAAWSENRALRARHLALEQRGFELAQSLDALEIQWIAGELAGGSPPPSMTVRSTP